MKKIMLTVCLGLAVLSAPVQAAEADGSAELLQQETKMTIAAIEVQRKAVLMASLHLASDDTAFWKVYNAYREAMAKVTDRRVAIIQDYADLYRSASVTDKAAKSLIGRYLKNQEDQVKVKRTFQHKFSKVLSGKKMARFYQVDHRMDLMVDMEIAQGVPLVE